MCREDPTELNIGGSMTDCVFVDGKCSVCGFVLPVGWPVDVKHNCTVAQAPAVEAKPCGGCGKKSRGVTGDMVRAQRQARKP